MFDKAEEAESIEKRKENLQGIDEKIADIEKQKAEAQDTLAKEKLDLKKQQLVEIKTKIQTRIQEEEVRLEKEK